MWTSPTVIRLLFGGGLLNKKNINPGRALFVHVHFLILGLESHLLKVQL